MAILNESTAVGTSTRIARNAGAVLVARGMSIVVRLLTISLFATYLGKEGFGVYSYIVALGEILAVLSDFGLIPIGVREIARDKSTAAEQFGNILALKGLLSVVTVVILVGLTWTVDMDAWMSGAVAIYTVGVVLNYYANSFFVFYRAFERMEYESVLIILERVLYLVFAIVAVQWDLGLYGVFWGNLLSSAVKLVVAPILTHLKVVKLKLRVSKASFVRYFLESLPIGVGMFLSSVYLRVDILILEYLRGSAEVGGFSGAYRIVDAMLVLPVVIVSALFPVLSRRAVASEAALHSFLDKAFKVLLLLAFPLAMVLGAWAELWVTWILDKSFVESIASLRLLAIVLVLSYPNFLFNHVMTALGKQKAYTITVALGLILNAAVAMLLVPSMGYIGACVATIVAESFVFLVAMVLLRRYAHYTLAPAGIWKPLLAAATMVAIALVGRSWQPVMQASLLPLAAVSYAAGILLLGALTADERSLVRSVLSGLLRPHAR